MSRRNLVITVFEHQRLAVGDLSFGQVFEPKHWNTLRQMHASLPLPYYTLTHRGIKLSHYVGVLKTPEFVLEILPKADAHPQPSPPVWRHLLVDMIAECKYLSFRPQRQAVSSLAAECLLDFFLSDFLVEVEQVCQRGLIRQYRTVDENARSATGQLLFAQQLRHNAVHQERFFIRHQRHTTQHQLHHLLKQALLIVARVSHHPRIRQRSQQLLHYFVNIHDTFASILNAPLHYNRQTEAYRTAVTVAQQILASSFAHVYHGATYQGFALLFDMNQVFEDFVYQRLRRLSSSHGFTVHRQTSRSLWGKTKVRPDIVVELPDGGGNVVIDTKWKTLTSHRPAAQDLHQLYVYNQLFQARRGILLYPDVHQLAAQRRPFEGPGRSHAQIDFITIADDERTGLNPSLDESLLRLLR